MDSDFVRETDRAAARVAQTAEQARARFERIGRVSGQAASVDGAFSVEVNAGGQPIDIRITAAGLRAAPEVIAKQIMALAELATGRAGEQMYYALAPVLGASGQRHLRSLGYQPMPDTDDSAGIR